MRPPRRGARALRLPALVIAALFVLLPAGGASAAFPGGNGKIAFETSRTGNSEVFVMNADGSGPVDVSNNTALDSQPSFSPDGTKIAFRSDRDGNGEVYVMNADGSRQRRLTHTPADEDVDGWQPLR